jgi:hypothetical protein
MFSMYEVAGVGTNLLAGLLGAKWGIRWTLLAGLTLQLVGLGALFGWQVRGVVVTAMSTRPSTLPAFPACRAVLRRQPLTSQQEGQGNARAVGRVGHMKGDVDWHEPITTDCCLKLMFCPLCGTLARCVIVNRPLDDACVAHRGQRGQSGEGL